MADKRVVLTEEGLKKLEEKLEYLKSVRRLEVAERLKAAIALGDLSENSEYDDAKNEQAFIEGEILTLEKQIRNSEIIKADVSDANKNVVHLGNTVVIKDMEYDEDETYTIVGSTEADTTEGKISNESPVGAAILGKTVGTIVQVKVPAGVLEYKIMEIKK
ncbi:MAG TPA: transcription elongation factor GreA [Candidatus Megamonas gallistercoris]|uniref:Transcription elongation factor GreA n=1 Tax=Megamonas hypermegale TaxID=158847 RepID=A0A921L788_9FIRM|nr:transcription elongation factor GreA [Megamonas hypermegale]MDM8142354.1 transcription elongation factor GreA [Megamonas hypermegale]HIX84888.1 transcription elongation factor GreA [Candidatus Megamonas gallistercoris]HJF84584.1 transcription elongation factor GreA [Megamonas hypermegale]